MLTEYAQNMVIIIVFIGVIVVIAFDLIDMMLAALLGVCILIITGIFTQEDILNVTRTAGGPLALLFGGMVVARVLVPTGLFAYVGSRYLLATRGSGRRFILSLFFLVGPLCAVLPNATTVILLAPIIIRVAKALKVDFVGPMIGYCFNIEGNYLDSNSSGLPRNFHGAENLAREADMRSTTPSPGRAGKTRGTHYLAILTFLILFSLVFCGGEAAAVTWQDQGPSPLYDGASVILPPPNAPPSNKNPVAGAIQSVLVDPNDDNVIYIGACNGGIWKTTDGGAAWTPLTDTLTSLSMGGMALDPGNPSRILAGNGQFSNSGQSGPREGVIFSSDAGNTWNSIGGAITYNTNVASVLVKDQVMFVASRSRADSPEVVTGLFRSTDGGTSFIQLSGSGGLPLGSVTSLAADPSNDNRVYAALQNSGIFRSDDRGKTWTNITPPGSGIGAGTAYIQLSAGALGQSLFMGLTSGGEKSTVLQSVWRSLDRGATWQNMGGQGGGPGQGLPGTLENGAFVGINNDGQGKINFALLADRHDPNIVYISGDDQPTWNQINADPKRNDFPNQIGATGHNGSLYRGDASRPLSSPPQVDHWTPTNPFPYNGQWLPITDNFTASGTTPHADSRSLTFDSTGRLLATDDGGIYRRSAPQSSAGDWTSLLGNLQITEMWSVAYDSNSHTLISGNQDNGAGYQNIANGKTWTAQVLADGGKTAVNDQNPTFSVLYMDSQDLGSFTRIKVGPQNNFDKVITKFFVVLEDGRKVPLRTGEGSDIPRRAAVVLNQADQTKLAIGADEVYLATDDVSGKLAPDLDLTSISTKPFTLEGDANPVIAYGRPGNANLLLAGAGKELWLSTTLERKSLKQLDNYPRPLGKNYITSVCINANSDSLFYVADGSVMRSTSFQGASWITGLSLYGLQSLQFITNGLNAVVAGGYGALYAARDTDLNNWYSLKGNLPNTFVWEMDYSSQDDTLAAGTLGRGAFTLAQASTLMPAPPSPLDPVDRGWIRLLRSGSGDQTINGGTVQTPESITWGNQLTLTALGGTFDTFGPNPNSGTDSTLNGVISGPGSFTITGNGTLFLRNANTYEGGTIVNGARVNVRSDANLGKASERLTFDGGTLQTAQDFTSARDITLMPYGGAWNTFEYNSTLSGVISGPGTLSKLGEGALTLTGKNTYSGGTLLNGGTLQVSMDDNLGAATGPLTFNGGTLQAAGPLTNSRTLVALGSGAIDTGSFASVFNGELFGYGSFTQLGAGSLTLGGDGSAFTGIYDLKGGALTLNNALGSDLAPCGLVVNPGTTFSGGGNLVGSLNLQGDGSGFSGGVVVPFANTINLNNTLGGTPAPCTVVVKPGGLITGSGTMVGALTNQGVINPGNSPGTLNVVGSFTQTATGVYTAEIASPTSYDRIIVTGVPGTANLAGAISPVLMGGYRPPGNTVFSGVVTATGGITGAFNPLANPVLGPTLFWQPRYSANSVDLVVQRDYANPGLHLNSNQLAVGTMLNGVSGATSGDLNTALNAIDSLPTAAAVQEAFKQISPEKAGALAHLGLVAATFQVRHLATRTTNLRFVQGESGGSGAGSLTSGSLSCNYSSLGGLMLAYNGASLANLFSARKEIRAPQSRWGLFADGGAALGSQRSSSNQTGYNFTLGGLTLGADYRLRDNLLVGLATGYSHTASGFCGAGGSVAVNSIPVNAYAAYFSGSLYAYGSLGYALNLFNLKRDINFAGISRTAASSATGNQFNLYGETGYDLKLRRFILTPSVTLAYSALWVGGFSEKGAGALNLRVAPQNASSVQAGVGGRLTVPLKVGRALVVPQAYAFYQHEFADDSRGLRAGLSQGSSTFSWQTDGAGRNFALVGASVTLGIKENLYAQVNFSSDVGRGNSTAHYLNAGLRFEF